MIVSVPFSAPACPPETGASTKRLPWSWPRPRARARCRRMRSCGRPHAVAAETGERAVVAVGDATDVVVVADTYEDELGALRGLARRRRGPPAVLPGPGLRLAAVRMKAHRRPLGLEMPGHRIAHDAEADEGALGHCFPSLAQDRRQASRSPQSRQPDDVAAYEATAGLLSIVSGPAGASAGLGHHVGSGPSRRLPQSLHRETRGAGRVGVGSGGDVGAADREARRRSAQGSRCDCLSAHRPLTSASALGETRAG